MSRLMKWLKGARKGAQALAIISVTKNKEWLRCNHTKLMIYQFAVSSLKKKKKKQKFQKCFPTPEFGLTAALNKKSGNDFKLLSGFSL